jgi:prepilin-type N-terminal cleavage/methylation domain-containing protein
MRKGFTFIEMIFVIVIMGILAKFGSEIFRNVYQNYNNSKANNELQIDTELTLQQIANRLQYRIKDSVIGRRSNGDFTGLSSIVDSNYTAFEWVGYDIDGWLGNNRGGAEVYNKPTWTGFIDVDAIDTANADVNTLFSPGTDTGEIGTVIAALSPTGAGAGNSALFFTGGSTDIRTGYDWNTTTGILTTQNNVAAHRVATTGNVQQFADATGASFAGTDIYEQYKLAWTAYALSLEDFDGDGNNDELVLYYDYRPWEGDDFTDNNIPRALFIDNVSTVKLRAIGDMINIQVCISENNITGSEYSICKEKAIF